MQSATPPEKQTARAFRGRSSGVLSFVRTASRRGVGGERPSHSSNSRAIRAQSRWISGTDAGPPAARGIPSAAATFLALSLIYVIAPASSTRICRPPISRQPLAAVSPLSKKTAFVVPPPMSRLITVIPRSSEARCAPLPFPARTDSRSGPAVETTNSPAKPESDFRSTAAFSLRAASPVTITAPVPTSDGAKCARPYSVATILRMPSPSSRTALRRGVK